MLTVDPIVAAIDRAVNDGHLEKLTATLERLGAEGAFAPELFPEPREQRYGRGLVWCDPARRYLVIACTWAPHQRCGLHDHAGFWGAELVVSGAMEETTYELKEQDHDRFRFERGRTRTSGPGAVGVIAPPSEYHEFGNPSDGVSHTLHVYGGNLVQCRLYDAEDGGVWWRAQGVDLAYDA